MLFKGRPLFLSGFCEEGFYHDVVCVAVVGHQEGDVDTVVVAQGVVVHAVGLDVLLRKELQADGRLALCLGKGE